MLKQIEERPKKCVKCGKEYPATSEYFGKTKQSASGLKGTCKKCLYAYNKIYHDKNKEELILKRRIYYQENKKLLYDKKKEYTKKNKEKVAETAKRYKEQNKEKLKEWQNKYTIDRLNTDKAFREAFRLRNQLRRMLFKKADTEKNRSLVGCDVEQLTKHFESLFCDGMNWENHGTHGWHIDHIIPCVAFDLMNEQEVKECFHYTNLQPLWAKDNMKKRTSMPNELSSTNMV